MKGDREGRLIFHAPSIHEGGGLTLLKLLLSVLDVESSYLILDGRLPSDVRLPNQLGCYRSKPGFWGRFQSEYQLKKVVKKNDTVLCFGNLPPLFNLKTKKVILFLQNRFLIDNYPLSTLTFKFRMSILLQRLWLHARLKSIKQYIVQTPSMYSILKKIIGNSSDIKNLALVNHSPSYKRSLNNSIPLQDKKYDFIYVASAERHKNHRRLIDAWVLLAKQHIFPSLCLTITEKQDASFYRYYKENMEKYALKIDNVGKVAHEKITELYDSSRALIYPSILESFGLPLLEAREKNLPIIASEMDYVRDLVDPEQTFDPFSAMSIARAVKRFLTIPEAQLPFVDGETFLQKILFVQGNENEEL